ncbi:MAG: hypothetical protein A3C43_05805 [Candidatus Schekmanbacteria bacterium RIFCSPHIGHO2_02_FULL_38_11]|uniref:L,D-TPase catalytic domain-containing protein n=1 Tax=Candidatus Schekmanbacteria bacterium RIFCSPLOWO2_12_FULL_38_15 TaxID=1817883 RepID=A0A1F7SMQ5_9BACT|nr:MAG: hypothetical protein A2043_05770 [Candidatus Schekmanbacteria bacterium GWA2_38_9]OGL48028.1 MAG: hypothetical protein A3H37_08370 [Candidatus Schekmanbacteria bacterium RIFCSPLOWO2_02_FULL_38_14]OGL54487.1 MAG: hypothetical protein A3G31_10020 [Candidatus Schekmanbacteria bacterium RIFCSPLOWO2_12_FULL_38_15]OGL55687.1 MAG: hypothetical protein A3C43_05805 [Candidatus Schekmanbacteria bacterium RIFCSPHIGHO2_02_FULL_38_11]
MKTVYIMKYFKTTFSVLFIMSLFSFSSNHLKIAQADEALKFQNNIKDKERQRIESDISVKSNISSALIVKQFLRKISIEESKEDIKIVVYKSNKLIEVYKNGNLNFSQNILLSPFWREKKEMRGDKKTPEGKYYVCCKKNKSKYNYFIGISYPNDLDALYALKKDLISVKEFISIDKAIKERKKPPWNTKLGGYIGIHGTGKDKEFESKWKINWTDGCIAISDDAMEKVYNIVEIGTPVMILP